jgi:splicing factor 3B subunit 3
MWCPGPIRLNGRCGVHDHTRNGASPLSPMIHTDKQHMRTQNTSLVGRDHLAYRGYYAPVMGVIDGDLCESFGLLPYPQQQAIAEDLEDRSVPDVLKKLEQMRTSAAF